MNIFTFSFLFHKIAVPPYGLPDVMRELIK